MENEKERKLKFAEDFMREFGYRLRDEGNVLGRTKEIVIKNGKGLITQPLVETIEDLGYKFYYVDVSGIGELQAHFRINEDV